MHRALRSSGFLAAVALAAALLSAAILLGRLRESEEAIADLRASMLAMQKADTTGAAPVSPLLIDYQLDLPGRGEVFPAMAAGPAPEYWPVAVLRITNTADRPAAQIVTAEIHEWSRRMERTIVVGARETERIQIQPELLPSAHRNEEIRAALLDVRAVALDGTVLFAQSRPVLIHGGSEIFWGRRFANAQMAARWVTPHDPAVLELVSEARAFIPRGRMGGYVTSSRDPGAVAAQVRRQAAAVYRALQRSGITYVSSIFVMGEFVNEAQRIRLPAETLRLRSANCMDVSVVFASAMENLDMQPLLVIVPGHAFAGVRLGKDSEEVLYLDLTVLPDGSFNSAVSRARGWMRKTTPEEVLVVDVAAARSLAIYPIADSSRRPALPTGA